MRHYRVAERAKDAGIDITAGQVGQLEKLLDRGVGLAQIGSVVAMLRKAQEREQEVDRALKSGNRVTPSKLGHEQ